MWLWPTIYEHVLFSLNVQSLGYTYVNWEQFNFNLPMTKSVSTDLFNKIKCNEFVLDNILQFWKEYTSINCSFSIIEINVKWKILILKLFEQSYWIYWYLYLSVAYLSYM